MMLDMKRTFDEVVQSQASPGEGRADPGQPLLHRGLELVRGHAGVHGDGEARPARQGRAQTGRWDLIVVDTPPSRSALDFLDAPERLSSFLDGRFMKLLLAPARGPARLMTAGFGMVTNAITKIIGAQVLQDMKAFVAAFDTLFGGFRQRAQRTFELLQDRRTAFLVVAAPEPDALREAAYFVERLRQERMPLAGLVVNRASSKPEGDLSAHAAMTGVERLRSSGEDHGLAAGLLRLHADRQLVVEREKRLTRPIRDQPSRRTHGGAAGAVDRRARPRRPAPHRRAAGRPGGPPAAPLTRSDGVRVGNGSGCERRSSPFVLGLRGLEQLAPRRHVRPLAQQCTALTLGEAAPHAPLDLVVQRLRQAFRPHGTGTAHGLGLVLLRSAHEQLVRC